MKDADRSPPGDAPDHRGVILRLLPAALIVGVALLVYLPALRAGFVWDDDEFLTANRLIHASDGLGRFWSTATTPDYYPLTSSMLWFEWRLWGPNAAGYHLVNVLLHAASAILLWRVLLRLKLPGAWLAGLLFALHPVAVESVAWITERKNTLPMMLYLASILAWLRYEDCRSVRAKPDPVLNIGNSKLAIGNYSLSLVLFLLALLSKTSVVILPAVLLICAWWRKARIERRDLLRVLPFAALATALGLVTVWFQYHNAIGAEVVRNDGLAARAACAGWAAWFYLYKALLPVHLCFVYPRWTTSASLLAFAPGLLMLAALFLFWLFRQSWGRPCLFALGYFLVALLPVLGFLNIYFMKYSLVADHWQYTALIGPVALVAGLLGWFMERRRDWRPVATACAGALVLACGLLTFRQTLIYHDDEALWRDTLSKNPKAWIADDNLCTLLVRQATAPGANSAPLLAEAARHCEAALRELDQLHAPKSWYATAYLNRGNIRAAGKRYAEAVRDFDEAIARKPNSAEAWLSRGAACDNAGRPDEALRDLDQAIALRPDYAEAYVARGALRAAAGRWADAIRDYDQAIAINPRDADAWFNRSTACANTGRAEDALRDLDRAIALRPGDAEAYCNRGTLRAAAGRYDEAIRDFDRAIACDPRYADAWFNRANACLAVGRRPEALADLLMVRKLGGAVPEELLRSLGPPAQSPR